MRLVFTVLFLSAALFAQLPKVELTWDDTNNPAGSTTYTVRRATGLCSGSPTFSTIATGLSAKTFMDDTVTAGNYCYIVTATASGIESAPSNTSQATVPAAPPANLQTQIK